MLIRVTAVALCRYRGGNRERRLGSPTYFPPRSLQPRGSEVARDGTRIVEGVVFAFVYIFRERATLRYGVGLHQG